MDIKIQKAKNGENTACAGNHFLHSNYAPVKEAERFVENLNIPYTPSSIIITEPALSYVSAFLKNKYPQVKLGVIRYSDSFSDYNSSFDFVINYFEHADFEAYLESRFTEEELLQTFFTPWLPSSQAFAETDKIVWNCIKAAMERSKTLLITRQYFEKRWLLNSCNFLKYTSSIISFPFPIDKNVLIISSGPSLKPFIPLIKENQNKFFIISLSSSISLCLKNKIIPDICMTTDGGYWAGEHLKSLRNNNIPLAMPAEAYCKKSPLSELTLLPLDYGDGISHDLIKASGLPYIKAVRNGTVSGTALLFAINYFTRNIYMCGFDMAAQRGFQHSQPNQLEVNASIKDNRIRNKITRLTRSELTNGSLDIYKQWFKNNPIDTGERKVFRLINKEDSKNSLGWIKDLEINSFRNYLSDITAEEKISFKAEKACRDLKACLKVLLSEEEVEKNKKQLFPLDFVNLSHNPEKKEIKDKIENEWKKIQNKAETILNADL